MTGLASPWRRLYVLFDPTDRDTFYAERQQGEVHRISLQNGDIRRLRPEPAEGQPRYRFNWNSPMIMSRHKPGVIYLGSNCVFRLTDRMEKYSGISPDLTRNEPGRTAAAGSGAETYGTAFSLAESPERAGLLWARTDDGRLWITENEGGKWTELTKICPSSLWRIRPEADRRAANGLRIEPFHLDANVAYGYQRLPPG